MAARFAEALTLLHRREADPVEPATIVGADLADLVRLQEVHYGTQRLRGTSL